MKPNLFSYENKYAQRNTSASTISLSTGFVGSSIIGSAVSSYNSQYVNVMTKLNTKRIEVAEKLSEKLVSNPQYDGFRSKAVDLAWEYEKEAIEMGGKGSANWNKTERQEIIKTGHVRGAQGHHQKNVADHLKDQANPDNIKFFRSQKEHLEEGHKGDWRNSSDGAMIDKNEMLRRTNQRRVVRKEIQGVALVAAIAFGVGASIEVVSTLARDGITIDSVKSSLINGTKSGLKSMAIGMATYSLSRVVSSTLQHVFKIGKVFAQTATVTITAVGFAVIEFVQLKKNGYTTKNAMMQAGKSLLIGLGIYAISFIPYCGTALSIAVSVIYVAATIAKDVHQQKYLKKLQDKTIIWSAPVLV